MKLSIVIPVYNEKNTIKEILAKIETVKLDFSASGATPAGGQGPAVGWEKEIILIDDFSTDGTREILKNLNPPKNYKIFFQNKNIGKGRAVKKGFEESSGDVILIQDADLEYNPGDYPKLIRPIIEGRADAVYGSRFLDKNLRNKIVYRRGYITSKALNWLSNVLSGFKLTDMYTGYKVFSKKAIEKITPLIESKRFGIDPELTALIAKNKFRILEVPIRYQGRTYQEGKKINWKDGLVAVFHIIRFNLFK